MSIAHELTFTHVFVPAPAGEASKHTLLLLHGTGGNEHDLVALGHRIDPSAALLSPRGKVLEQGMPRFFRRLAEGVFDIPDLKRRTQELADFVEAAAGHYGLDQNRIIAVGYSNGANIAASMMLLRPEVLHEAILFRPMVPLVPEPLPDLSDFQVLIAAGNQDPIVSMDETERLATLLRNSGAEVTSHLANAGHGLTAEEIDIAANWIAAKLSIT
jgi:predicted esterase